MVTYEIVIPPQHGSVVITDNTAEYNADPGYEGYDSFTYVKKEDGVEVTTRKVCIEVETPVYPKIWKPAGGSCEVVSGLITGKLIYSILQEIDTLSGNPTGVTKPNVPSDPDYVAPIIDTVACPAATGWRGYAPTAYCQTNPDSSNTGNKIYVELEQYYLSSGHATGVRELNEVSNPNYIPPIPDPEMCPVGVTYTAIRSGVFYSENCVAPKPIASPIQFSKTYQSTLSQADANNLAANDPDFVSDGQAYANAYGSCVADTVSLLQYDAYYRQTACDTAGQQNRILCGTQEDFEDLSTVTTEPQDTGIFFYKDLSGLVKIDSGWYMGLDNNKSFFADSQGQITHYEECTMPLPALHLAVEEDVDGNMQVMAMLSAPYTADVIVGGRIDVNPLNATDDGVSFNITIPQGSQQATDPNFVLERDPNVTYYWQNWHVTPNNFTVNRQDPI